MICCDYLWWSLWLPQIITVLLYHNLWLQKWLCQIGPENPVFVLKNQSKNGPFLLLQMLRNLLKLIMGNTFHNVPHSRLDQMYMISGDSARQRRCRTLLRIDDAHVFGATKQCRQFDFNSNKMKLIFFIHYIAAVIFMHQQLKKCFEPLECMRSPKPLPPSAIQNEKTREEMYC